MNEKDKDLLLKDICGRLPYGVKVQIKATNCIDGINTLNFIDLNSFIKNRPRDEDWYDVVTSIKPYLRPMSSMTEEEKEELLNHVLGGEGVEYFHIAHDGSIDGNQEAEQDLYNLNLHWLNFGPLTTSSYIDWLNKNMFDYRGLIPKNLAISTEIFNPYKD